MGTDAFVIGVDFGTDSVRSVIADTRNGQEIASAIFHYPRWKKALYCDPAINQFRQHPRDYLEGLEQTIRECLYKAGPTVAAQVVAISADTTGSTPVAVDQSGLPLALLPAFEENPNAMFVLWKDHTAVQEAAAINEHAEKFEVNYLQYVGGLYSSEWFWAKLLHVLRVDLAVRSATYSWVEHCDWIPHLLTGGKYIRDLRRSQCAAGHKALWAESFGGLPPNDFFASLDPLLDGFTQRLFTQTFTSSQSAGFLSEEWAGKWGLTRRVQVGIGAFDAHMGAVGGQIEPYHLTKVMGTSTCDMLVAPRSEVSGKLVKGICGQVPHSIIPGMIGMEAGQSAFGDSYAWFRDFMCWPLRYLGAGSSVIDSQTAKALSIEIRDQLITALSAAASIQLPDDQSPLAVDWLNGRRSPYADQRLKMAISGLNLATDPVGFFRAIVESTCFGAKSIIDCFTAQGLPVLGLIGVGGVAKKSPFIMQMMADVTNIPIRIHRSEQTCAQGAAMFAATAAGIFPIVEEAMQTMGLGFESCYYPNPQLVPVYAGRYRQFQDLAAFIDHQTTNLTTLPPSTLIDE